MIDENVGGEFPKLDDYFNRLSSFQYRGIRQEITWPFMNVSGPFTVSHLAFDPCSICEAPMLSYPCDRLYIKIYWP
jgi:hypothetical protein